MASAMGARAAHRWFLTAERFDAAEAHRIGFVHEVVAADALDDKVGALYELAGIFTRNGANIIEVTHQRIFGVLSAKNIQTEFLARHLRPTPPRHHEPPAPLRDRC